MKRFLAAMMLALALIVDPGVRAFADAGSGDPATSSMGAQGGPGDVGADTWIGAAAAIGCGIYVRATIVTGGMFVGTWVGAVATCGLMLFDAVFLEPSPKPGGP